MSSTLAVHVNANPARTRARTSVLPSTIAWSGVLLLAALAPFEALEPVLRLPWQSVSNVEMAIAIAGAAWAVALWAGGDREWWRTPLSAPWGALVIVLLASALVAPASRINALHMTARIAVAGGVFLMTASGANSGSRIRSVTTVAATAGVLVALLAILEFLSVRPVVTVLGMFRVETSVVGAQVRASGPLQYPTIASMYLEIAFAFALGLLVDACRGRGHARSAAWTIALIAIAEGIVLTFTRAGLISMAASLGLVGVWWVRHRGAKNLAFAALATVSAIVALEVVASHPPGTTRLRMTTEAQEAWYRAAIDAPSHVTFDPDQTIPIPITLVNTGRVTWDSAGTPPFLVSYHWVMPHDDRVVAYEGLRTAFPRPVPPGSAVTLAAQVRAPRRAGEYRLLWDVSEEGRLWFTTEPEATAIFSTATVAGASSSDPGPLPLLPQPTIRPGRLALWRAAIRIIAAHPWLGVGPDNFRLSYGPVLGLAHPDPRVHTNNMYLEVATGAGLAGAAVFGWLLWTAIRTMRELLARARAARLTPLLGVAAGGLAIVVHGFVDSFLGFTPVYVLFAITLGLAAAGTSRFAGESDADRV